MTYRSCVSDPAVALLRRALVAVVATLSLLAPAFVATSASAAGSAFDNGVSSADCDLLGRAFTPGLGCSRKTCVKGAKLYRKVYGAEACRLRSERDFGFVSTIESRRCAALGRRWMGEVNYCATYPDRSPPAIYDALQCTGSRSVYVPLSEKEGFYDECLTPARVRELTVLARVEGSNLKAEVALRSSVQCQWRPEHVFSNGKCVSSPGSRPATGGVVMVGDSLTWRGTDELTRLRPTFTVDGEPARQLSALKDRLASYTALRGAPTGVIIALGTVPAPKGFGKSDLVRVVKGLPKTAELMFVMPYAENVPGRPTQNTVKVVGWMKSIAKGRSKTCLADWPAYVRTHRGILQDGVHVKRPSAKSWARFVTQQWSRC